ncbi:MAG: GlsB/YeaQ/YmgE family stress response membrane protein [Pirellulaceae bacterium]|nr:GlsB/YeaQ/YmgE family stress response membrane protein [Pirellulaceae bacterium]
MHMGGLLGALLIGAICGFLAGKILKGRGLGILADIVVGILGAAIFGWLFGNFDLFQTPILNEICGGTIGAIILLLVVGLFTKSS